MTNTTIDWTKYQSEFVKWTHKGQVVEGVLVNLSIGSYQGNEYPELKIRTADGEVTLSASQSRLQRLLAENAPAIGERIRIEYLGEADTAKPGQSPAKLFAVDVFHKDASTSTGADELV